MRKVITLSLFVFSLFGNQLIAQNLDLCKIMDAEGIHGKLKYGSKSAAQTSFYDVNFYRLDLNLDPNMYFFSGAVTTYFTPNSSNFNSIVFDFSNQMVIDSVKYHNQSITFSTTDFKIVEANFPSTIPVNTLDSITIYYRGSPSGSITSVPYARVDIPGGDLIWTLSEPYGAQEWWPCKNDLTDKADSVEVNVTTPLPYKVATNGLLLKKDTLGTMHTYHYKTTYPTVAYLVAINVGTYDFYQEHYQLNGDSILMEHYLYTDQTQAESSSGVLEFMTFFDSLLGPYPFIKEKYGHMSFTFGGGMEHQTISSMGAYGGELKAHELAHQWFGDKVTCGSWRDLWLNEGFATYLTGLTYEFNIEHDPRFWAVWKSNAEVGSFNFPHGSVYRYGTDTNVVSTLFNGQVYNKGAITLHTLRWLIGDSAFFAGTRNYVNDPNLSYGFANTPDLQAHYEASSGRNLDEFFNDWIYGKGYPVYNSFWRQNGTNFSLKVEQIPTDSSVSFFEIPVPYKLTGTNWDTTIIVNPSSNIQTFNLTIPQTIIKIELDVNNDIFALEGITTSLGSELQIENQIKIYPNPSRSFIQIDHPSILFTDLIQIFDNQGKLITETKSKSINTTEFPNGIYFMRIHSNLGIIQKKFQKIN